MMNFSTFQQDMILSSMGVLGPHCTKLTINGNSASNGNYHGNIAQQPIQFKVSMVGTTDDTVTINSKFTQQDQGFMPKVDIQTART